MAQILLKQKRKITHYKYLFCHIGPRTNFMSNICPDLELQQILVVKDLIGKSKIKLYELGIWLMRQNGVNKNIQNPMRSCLVRAIIKTFSNEYG